MANTTKIERAWNYIVSHLHHNGKRRNVLAVNDHYEVRSLADGYGGGTTNPTLIWDWSHVRDSSDEAILKMATALRKKVRAQNKAGI